MSVAVYESGQNRTPFDVDALVSVPPTGTGDGDHPAVLHDDRRIASRAELAFAARRVACHEQTDAVDNERGHVTARIATSRTRGTSSTRR